MAGATRTADPCKPRARNGSHHRLAGARSGRKRLSAVQHSSTGGTKLRGSVATGHARPRPLRNKTALGIPLPESPDPLASQWSAKQPASSRRPGVRLLPCREWDCVEPKSRQNRRRVRPSSNLSRPRNKRRQRHRAKAKTSSEGGKKSTRAAGQKK